MTGQPESPESSAYAADFSNMSDVEVLHYCLNLIGAKPEIHKQCERFMLTEGESGTDYFTMHVAIVYILGCCMACISRDNNELAEQISRVLKIVFDFGRTGLVPGDTNVVSESRH